MILASLCQAIKWPIGPTEETHQIVLFRFYLYTKMVFSSLACTDILLMMTIHVYLMLQELKQNDLLVTHLVDAMYSLSYNFATLLCSVPATCPS